MTEGMQRLCAIANRIVAHEGEVSRIERDLLLEDLRRLYEVALRLGNEELGIRNEELADAVVKKEKESVVMEPDEEMLSSTVMATMAAMGVVEDKSGKWKEESVAAAQQEMPQVVEPEPEPVPEPELVPEPVLEPEPEPVEVPQMEEIENNGNSLLFDEVIIEDESEKRKEESVADAPQETQQEETRQEETQQEETQQAASLQVEPEKHVEVKPEPKPEPKPEQPEPVPEHHTTGAQASLLDYLKRPVEEKPTVKTLGEKVTTGTHNLGEQLNSKKVSDLRTVININDKFSFMSELFHNNMKAYNDFILRLNAIDTRDEALMCVNEVSAQYKWDEGSLAVQSFYKVFDKKF